MQIKKGIKIIIVAILFIAVATYIVYAMIVATDADSDNKCTDIELNIEQNPNSGFINNNIIEKILRDANVSPKDKLMSNISTRQIEEVLKKNEFIEKVECYKTASNKIAINITQRTPVIYIMPDKGDGYYVDKYGKIITKSSYPVNMPVATGQIIEKYAKRKLSQLGSFLINNEFWNNQIEQINVSVNSDKECVIDLVPRVGDQIIHLGRINNFERKLNRLMLFYRQAMPKIGWNNYSMINLEYEGQIICKKQNKNI